MFSSNSSQVSSAAVFVEEIFQTYLYTGNGATQTITNNIDLSTYGGLVWAKDRSSTNYHSLEDTVRGVGISLSSNSTGANFAGGGITAFNTNGYSIDSFSRWNQNTLNFVNWTFRKQPKFFDIVTYTGDGVAGRTVAHNLGSVPGCIIVKRTDSTTSWGVYHRSLGNTQIILLNTTAAAITDDWWNNTTPTSTQFYLATDPSVNAYNQTYVAYLFAHDAGGFGLAGTDNVISCGSFSTDGSGNATVSLGYEPQWLMFKATSVLDWSIQDTMRGSSLTTYARLAPNSSNVEFSGSVPIFAPNATGFTIANSDASTTFIYIAIRRGPMKVPTLGTSVFLPATRTGTGANATVTTAVSPVDMVWSFVTNGGLGQETADFDRLRGPLRVMYTGTTALEFSAANTLTGFDVQNGYRLGSDSSGYGINYSAQPFINYSFQRAPSFFDEVCYTGTGAGTTFNHNLGAVPEFIIVKKRAAATGTTSWLCYVASLGNTVRMVLNGDQAVSGSSITFWNNTTPTSTVFSVGTNDATNISGDTYVAYLFATCAGVSKVGSYAGNGTTQTINCGFGAGGARFVLIKRTDDVGGWYTYDTARGMTVLTDPYYFLNSATAEVATLGSVTTVSTGFAVNNAIVAGINAASPAAYIFLAIA